MGRKKAIIGFLGAGGIARSHAYSINSLKYYYDDYPETELAAVCSASESSRSAFARKYGFARSCSPEEFGADRDINTVYILGPNRVHLEHFKMAMSMPQVERIYIEKPVCSGAGEEMEIAALAAANPSRTVQVGFQYLFSPALREALAFWKTGESGRPVHFEIKYYHGDYLKMSYRQKRATRLTPAPDGGAMADLGSHAVSMLIAFLGTKLKIAGAVQAGEFSDVPPDSDLFSLITLYDENSGAAGTVASSRISSGTADSLWLEIYAEHGAIRYSSETADYFEYFSGKSGMWQKKITGSNYQHYTSFPSGHVPAGWLRAMVHAHYVFLTGSAGEAVIPGIQHGLAVQRIVNETAEHLRRFRESKTR